MHIDLKDFRVWMVVFLLMQGPFITQPPIDSSHSWRQSLTLTVARNMANGEGNMLYPRIDHNGDTDGVIGMEFPVFNAAIAGMMKLFGFTHWYGRLINLLFSLLGVFCFTKLVEAISDKKTGFWAGIFLLCSLWMLFMRKTMPDTLSIALVITGIWLGWRYYHFGKLIDVAGYFVLVSLGLLAKLPAAVVLAPFGMTLLSDHFPYKRKAVITGLTFLSLVLVVAWYFVWVPELVATYKYPLYFPRDLGTGFVELSFEKDLIFRQFVFRSFYSYVGFGLFLTGLFLASWHKEKILVLSAAIAFPVFVFFMIKTGIVFPLHNYYMIPIVPVMAVFAGFAVAHFPYPRLRPIIVAAALIESFANMQHDVRPKNEWYTELEAKMNTISDRSERVICNGGVGPQMMYFLNRKGWTHRTGEITEERVASYVEKGAKWLVLKKPIPEEYFTKNLVPEYEDEHVAIYGVGELGN